VTEENVTAEAEQNSTEENCVQVITHAYNFTTLEERDFPTPCTVPEGWIVGTPTVSKDGYDKLGNYTPKFYSNNKTRDNKYITYYPEDGIGADMPVVMFIKGGGSATIIENYSGIMQFLASKGYYVIGVDTSSYASKYVTQKLEIALNEAKPHTG
jgi:hypothetical protein